MPTYRSHLGAENILRAISGSHYLLFEGGGRTGNLDLHGSARFDYVNSSGLAVQNQLSVTGNQAVYGNFTGFNFNHLARISCTGDAYLRRITGNLQAAGNIDLNNDLRITGTCTITGSLILNGITITGNGGNITNIDSGTTINNYYTTGSSSDFSTGDFTVSGILRVRSKAFITGYSAYILNVSGLNSAAPIVNISGNSPGNPALKIVNGGAEAVFFQGGHRGSSAGIGTTVTLNPLPTEMVFEDGLLISYT